MKALKRNTGDEKNNESTNLSDYKKIDKLLKKHSLIESNEEISEKRQSLRNLRNPDGL